jgi:CheY-like chemotaxis protein
MNSIRALIVDDSSVMRKIVERSLRQAGIFTLESFMLGAYPASCGRRKLAAYPALENLGVSVIS